MRRRASRLITLIVRAGLTDASGRALLVGTAGTLGLNIGTVTLNFGLALVLTHALDAAGFGAYASAYAWAGILSVIAVLGLTPLVVRHAAAYKLAGSWSLLRGLLRWANQAVLAASVVVVGVAAVFGWQIYQHRPELLDPYLIGLAIVPLFALTSIRQAAMQGLGRVVLGRVSETLLTPALFIMGAVALPLVGAAVTPSRAMTLQVLATLAGFVVGATLLRSILSEGMRGAPTAYDTASWRRSAIPLVLLNVVGAANAQIGTIMLGAVAKASQAGIFSVSVRVTTFVSFVMVAAAYPLSPVVARLHAEQEPLRMQRLIVKAARVVLLVSIPVALVLVVFASQILSLFGSGFADGAIAIRIMVAGDLVNVLTGFGGVVLVMCGRESELARSVLLGAVLNVGLVGVLVPSYGITGAAIAAATALAASNATMTWLAWRRLGVWAAVAPMLLHR